MRRITVSVARIIHSVKMAMVRLSRFSGLTKFGVTPGGGGRAGPLSSLALNCSSGVVMVTVISGDKGLGRSPRKSDEI